MFFTPPLKNLVGKNPEFRGTSADRRQSEARNFEMAQRINKQITDVSSTIKPNLGGITSRGFSAT